MIVIHPAILHEAQYSPTLAYMLKHNLPLTRETWISINYLGHPPEPWTWENEAEVPEFWRKENLDDAQ
jgi:hypothetical protein